MKQKSIFILSGVGNGIVCLSLQLLLMSHFDKYRSSVLGITTLGMSLAGFLFPKFLGYLRDAYGYRKSLVISGALVAHISPLMFVLKAPRRRYFSQARNTHSQYIYMTPLNGTSDNRRITEAEENNSANLSRNELSTATIQTLCIAVVSAAITSFIEDVSFFPLINAIPPGAGLSPFMGTGQELLRLITELLGRVCIPFVADSGRLSRQAVLIVSLLFGGALLLHKAHLMPQYAMLLLRPFTDALVGCSHVMSDVLIADLFGLERLFLAQAFAGLIRAPLLLSYPALLGK